MGAPAGKLLGAAHFDTKKKHSGFGVLFHKEGRYVSQRHRAHRRQLCRGGRLSGGHPRHCWAGPVGAAPACHLFGGGKRQRQIHLAGGRGSGLGLQPRGGSRNFAFSTRDTHSGLHNYLRLHRGPYRPKDGFFLRAESFYNVSSEVDRLANYQPGDGLYQSYGGKSLHHQSHGESFLSLVHHRFWGQGIYLLDEPEAALSPARQLTLLAELHRLVQAGSQLVIATHSPLLMAYPQGEILLLGEGPIRPVEYRETEHYQITKSFLDSPERMLRILLRQDEEE